MNTAGRSLMYRIRPRQMEPHSSLLRLLATKVEDSVTNRLREHYDRRSQKLRDELDERRQKLRETASQYRESGINKYREFRENPKETAVSSAKTFSSMVRTYGPVFIGTYVSLYLVTLSSLYMGVASGVLDPVRLFATMGIGGDATTAVDLVYQFMASHQFSQPYAHYVQDYPPLANFGVAWITAKFTEPVRIPLAIGMTPRVARYIGYRAKEETDETTAKDASS